MKKWLIRGLCITGVLLAVIFVVNKQYPFSTLSMNKSFSYDADNIVVKQYVEDLNAFTKYFQAQPKEDFTTERLQYILEVFQMPLLTEKGPIDLKYEEIAFILNDLKYVRNILIELAFRENYDNDTKEYLKTALERSLFNEEDIHRLLDSKFHSRKTLKRQVGNLRVHIMSEFDAVVTFYKAYKGDL